LPIARGWRKAEGFGYFRNFLWLNRGWPVLADTFPCFNGFHNIHRIHPSFPLPIQRFLGWYNPASQAHYPYAACASLLFLYISSTVLSVNKIPSTRSASWQKIAPGLSENPTICRRHTPIIAHFCEDLVDGAIFEKQGNLRNKLDRKLNGKMVWPKDQKAGFGCKLALCFIWMADARV
jgi:hypothetical protein